MCATASLVRYGVSLKCRLKCHTVRSTRDTQHSFASAVCFQDTRFYRGISALGENGTQRDISRRLVFCSAEFGHSLQSIVDFVGAPACRLFYAAGKEGRVLVHGKCVQYNGGMLACRT